ncbi:ORF1 protein [Dioscorea bacilliform SN virus]|uniref:ORF1 protein n=2 Tax=Badnavirus TaxID=10652 RepID=A2T395_9VIRU|nr:ORF1 protein [Dioscorea bacilliform virus]ABI47981.1 ORF1 protein [Dioscorea bacilliform SN virus]ABI47984.1 ORF1 protein [Dioscorea bacilliform virus]
MNRSIDLEGSLKDYLDRSTEPEYLDLYIVEKPTNKQLANNLCYLNHQAKLLSRVSLKHFFKLQEEIQELKTENQVLRKHLVNLTKEVVENRPLTEKKVQELVLRIIEQPKEIEQQAVRLTLDLQKKLDRVEAILSRLEGAVLL